MSFHWPPNSWPAFIVGLMILTYWIRVLLLVIRTKRDVGRAANFIPPEKLGRIIRILWIPSVVLWVLLPVLTPLIGGLPALVQPMGQAYPNPYLAWVAAAIAAVAFYITWICWQRMGKSWRMGIDPNEKTQLIFTGPYAYVRHPIYALSQVLMVCTMVVLPSILMLIVGVIHIFFMQWEVRREDKVLAKVHGPAYENYIKQVGRFIPRLGRGRTTTSS